jgi:branched-chain amino acid transport system ATP-binding protein
MSARIIAIQRRGVTMFILEHNMDLVARLCQRVYVLSAGRMLFNGTPDEVINEPAVIETYLGAGTQ